MVVINGLELSDNIAIVGSSANILDKGYAESIDSHDDVIRFNRSIVEGYEDQVGTKTTVRVTNQHVFANVPYNRWGGEGQTTNFIKNTKNCKLLLLGHSSERAWIDRNQHTDPSCDKYRMDRIILSNGKLASVGLCFILYCVKNGLIPDVYGFGVGEEVMTHYWEDRDNNTPYHDFNIERDMLTKLNEENKIKLHL